MASDTVVSQFANVRLDAESQLAPSSFKTTSADVCASAVSVTGTGLPPSPPESPAGNTVAAVVANPEPESPALAAAGTFTNFRLLPAELRLKIWHMSFLPRTVELHTRMAHYADSETHDGTPKCQSQSRNPAALSVNAEARAAALECYTVALPLFAPPSRTPTFERPGDLLQDSDRVLYLNLEEDTVVLLGDLHYTRLSRLLERFRQMDKPARRRDAGADKGKGLRNLAMSVALWAHEVGGAATLKAFARTVFADIEEFVLFMYSERLPPPGWMGGPCVLEKAAADTDHYRRFVIGRGRQFRVGDGWMVVGQHPMKVADIGFGDGW
ncbi:hypothetical protein C8A00DRAFT_43482 [Chaetomidium leptoderma]|uniref:2EXR domain-containing protein n=1 Tax=Chaetomidium leptoderma TaxID=669021 RepID=A0AAN6VM43_9PEZI|nr:hypothetical protein C8A00DRAFT_43482 [Chaetomidium leptoderma]